MAFSCQPPSTFEGESEFRRFLVETKIKTIHLAMFTKVHVVLGNPTCDLDSAACTLVYAYLLHKNIQKDNSKRTEIVIPVLNLKTPDLILKTEVCSVLQAQDISLGHMITRTDVNLKELLIQNKLELTLVDHHNLVSTDDSCLEQSVVRVFDHRPPFQTRRFPIPIINTPVASCATLVALEIFCQYPNDLSAFSPEAIYLLYGAIILDTMNFCTITKRATGSDIEVIHRIESHFENYKLERRQIYETLLKARSNVTGLSTFECLLKDVKVLCGIPVCSLTTLVQEFVKKSDVEESLNAVQVKFKSKGVFLIGISILQQDLKRDIGIFSGTSGTSFAQISTALQQSDELNLGLAQIPDTAVKGLTIFTQKNLEKTRKHMMPVLQTIFQELS